MLVLMFCAVFAALLAFAALHDIATMTIPNWISIALTLAFFPAAYLAGLSISEIGLHFGFALAVFVVAAGMFFLGVWGGGDAKLVAAASIWTGLAGAMPFFYGIALVGGLLALILIVARRLKLESEWTWLSRLLQPTEGAPYAVAIAGGGYWAMNASPVIGPALRASGVTI